MDHHHMNAAGIARTPPEDIHPVQLARKAKTTLTVQEPKELGFNYQLVTTTFFIFRKQFSKQYNVRLVSFQEIMYHKILGVYQRICKIPPSFVKDRYLYFYF
jgi:hypothetical protein